ncbi:MAG: M18 family aminopeptidase [Gammaproteobacteria bacterium]|nr:M18 family aminopeptidase [Gammaproteobacteria bacterium]
MDASQKLFNDELIDFLGCSPTPFHAVECMSMSLEQAGYQRLYEADSWQDLAVGRYYVCRNDSAIIAFNKADESAIDNGFKMLGTHTDSPCLKIKPTPEMTKHSYYQLGVEVYGGALLNPWFDRDLSIAGRVTYKTSDDELVSRLIDFEKPVAIIPSLAIHMDREANNNKVINSQNDLPPLILQLPNDKALNFRDLLLQFIKTSSSHPVDVAEVLDYELSLYDTQSAAVVGLHDDFISSARLDNLLSCFVGLKALLESDSNKNTLLVCTDHEEVGSVSAAGAQGSFLKSVLQRLTHTAENLSRCLDRSILISADNAHGIHPNFSAKHDSNHGPILNKGPVIKVNSNQRYATNSETSALFRQLCEQADVPVQSFVVRSDMACGSTIGPITASGLGVKTIDVGVPTFAMHSIRETAGAWDAYYLFRVLRLYFS